MGYETRIQQIRRPNSNQYYVNFPRVLAKAMGFEKGEVVEWEVVDKDTLVLKRKNRERGVGDAR